jgi:hypothetical protein
MPSTASISYIEVGVQDAATSTGFLSELLGLNFHQTGAGPEGWVQLAGLKMGLHGGDPQQGFLVFLQVQDLDAAIADVIRLGGAAEPKTAEPGFGQFVICIDPQGLRFGLHQP